MIQWTTLCTSEKLNRSLTLLIHHLHCEQAKRTQNSVRVRQRMSQTSETACIQCIAVQMRDTIAGPLTFYSGN